MTAAVSEPLMPTLSTEHGGGAIHDDCPFCQIARGEAPATYATHPRTGERMDGRSGTVMILEPLNPCTPGHLLAIPTAHTMSAAASPAIAAYTMEEAAEYINLRGGQWNLITSVGRYATQTVKHLHIHLIPRMKDDRVRLPWSKR